jgi:hypothetical protein
MAAEPFSIVFAVYYCLASEVLWSELLATDQEVRVRFPALPDFLTISGSETCPLSLVSKIEEILERKCSGCSREKLYYGRRDPLRLPRDIPLPAKDGTNLADKRRSLGRYS